MMREFQMKTTVNKAELLAILKKNRDGHRKIFEEALDGYQKAMVRYLLKMLKDVRKGKRVHHMIQLPMPEDHTRDYDSVIKMVEMNQNETIELDTVTFANLVEDRWDWSHSFRSSNILYSTTLSKSAPADDCDE